MSDSRVDLDSVLGSLKDFQRSSVEYVFRKLYLEGKRRFLVADEVGLGKTLVARGVIAKAIDHLKKQGVQRIDIVYICSNGDIARQNVNRLNVTDRKEFSLASRITLLPTQIRGLKDNDLNFISFTPSTSFDLRSSQGTWRERVLLYWMLQEPWGLQGSGPMRVLEGNVTPRRFKEAVKGFDRSEIDEGLKDDFRRTLDANVTGNPDGRHIRARFEALAERLGSSRAEISREDRDERAALVSELRGLLATTCLKALEPDLIILDEFQRFKHLLEGKDDASQLARDLFTWQDARVLLLSATPYRMYTLDHEAGEDDHYEDFVRTVGFLQENPLQTRLFTEMLGAYGREARTSVSGNLDRLREAKLQLEKMLQQVMIRTERLAASDDRNGMLVEVPARSCKLESGDVRAYLALQKIAAAVEQPDTLEYWKSAPYLLSFMDDYVFKEKVTEGTQNGAAGQIAAALQQSPLLSLKKEELEAYKRIDPGNARLRSLLDDTVGTGLARLLWLPPSFPYYEPAGVHADVNPVAPTKRLVFSSWTVVPKVIAALVSYEAEREAMQGQDEKAENTQDARRRRRGLLRFARESEKEDGRLVGMPVLGLIYPGLVLAEKLDPLRLARLIGSNGTPPALEAVLAAAEAEAEKLVASLLDTTDLYAKSADQAVDENWYWAAPILLDARQDRAGVAEWLADRHTPVRWSGKDDSRSTETGDDDLWAQHVARASDLVAGRLGLGAPPKDLARVLALLGLAGPGVAAARALARVARAASPAEITALRNAAGSVGWTLRNLFNLPESMAIARTMPAGVRLKREATEPYWLSVLLYSAEGGLQAVLDEYVHVLKDSLGLIDKPAAVTLAEIAAEIVAAVGIRTAALRVDLLSPEGGRVRIEHQHSMRARFAVRFGQEEADDSQAGESRAPQTTRASQVRTAFNSPFWPFVLATTSVGQEGLDFHPYCHAIVHWNLPANPVDLEQREGRIHRYKGHAVRKNIATVHGNSVRPGMNGHADPWAALFDAASRSRELLSDIVPFWVYALKNGAAIERHVPALPLSRDVARLASLRKSLAVYRMVFGQARQEELLSYLMDRVPEADRQRLVEDLRIDLAPPASGAVGRR